MVTHVLMTMYIHSTCSMYNVHTQYMQYVLYNDPQNFTVANTQNVITVWFRVVGEVD